MLGRSLAVGELLRQLAHMRGVEIYLRLQPRLINSIEGNFDREPSEQEQLAYPVALLSTVGISPTVVRKPPNAI
eukprot:1699838-Pyramimonas_sp.AAC.1